MAELCFDLVSSMVVCNSAWVFVTAFNSSSMASIWDLKSLISSSLGKICCLRFSKMEKKFVANLSLFSLNQFYENFRENDFTEKVSIFLDVMKWKKMKKFENELTSKTK